MEKSKEYGRLNPLFQQLTCQQIENEISTIWKKVKSSGRLNPLFQCSMENTGNFSDENF